MVQIVYANILLLVLTLMGSLAIIDDDGLVGTTQLFTTPSFLLQLLLAICLLYLRNYMVRVMQAIVISRS